MHGVASTSPSHLGVDRRSQRHDRATPLPGVSVYNPSTQIFYVTRMMLQYNVVSIPPCSHKWCPPAYLKKGFGQDVRPLDFNPTASLDDVKSSTCAVKLYNTELKQTHDYGKMLHLCKVHANLYSFKLCEVGYSHVQSQSAYHPLLQCFPSVPKKSRKVNLIAQFLIPQVINLYLAWWNAYLIRSRILYR